MFVNGKVAAQVRDVARYLDTGVTSTIVAREPSATSAILAPAYSSGKECVSQGVLENKEKNLISLHFTQNLRLLNILTYFQALNWYCVQVLFAPFHAQRPCKAIDAAATRATGSGISCKGVVALLTSLIVTGH